MATTNLTFSYDANRKAYVAKVKTTSTVALQVNRKKAGSLKVGYNFMNDENYYYDPKFNFGQNSGSATICAALESPTHVQGIPVFWIIESSTLPTTASVIS